jgi:glucokinase
MAIAMMDGSNELDLLNRVRLAPRPLTKKDLADAAGWSLSQVNQLVAPLLERRLLVDCGLAPSCGGRPPMLLGLNPEIGNLVGIDIGGASSRAVVTDLSGNVVFAYRQETTDLVAGSTPLLVALRQLVERALAGAGVAQERLLGVGVALSGIVDHHRGVCVFCPNIPRSKQLPVVEHMSRALGVPVCVDDSLRGAVLAERHFGIAQGLDNFMLVAIGVGVGAGYLIDGRLHRGVGGLGGELGHITVRQDGPRCACGNAGCLEMYASGPGIVQRARESLERGMHSSIADSAGPECLSVGSIARAAETGDKMAFYIIDHTGVYLGTAIAAALNLLGLEEVILTGGVARVAGSILLDATQRAIRTSVMPILAPRVRVRLSEMDDLNVARGMISMIGESLFDVGRWRDINPLLKMVQA